MDEGVLKLLVAAVETIHSPFSTQQARLQAQEYLNRFLEEAANAADYGLSLAHAGTGCNDMVRHFGLHILDESIRYRWNNFTESQQLGLRAAVMKLAEEGTKDMLSETLYIKEKLVKAVVEVIKRLWPQRWPDLLPELTQLCARGPTQKELVLMIMRTLAEDLLMYDQENIAQKRKSELMLAVINLASDLFTFCRDSIQASMAAYQQQISPSEQKIQEKLATAAVSVFLAYFDGVDFKYVKDAQLIPLLLQLFQWPKMRAMAVECFLLLLAGKRTDEDLQDLMGLFDWMPVLADMLQAELASRLVDDQSLLFVKRLTQMLVLMFTAVLGPLLVRQPRTQLPPSLEQYLRVMLQTVHHPCLLVTSFPIPLWQALFEKPPPALERYSSQIAEPLLEAMKSLLEKADDWDPSKGAYNEFNEGDYDSEEKFSDFVSNLRGHFFKTTTFIASLYPLPCLSKAGSWLDEVLRQLAAMQRPPSKEDVIIKRWECTNALLERIINAVLGARKALYEQGQRTEDLDRAMHDTARHVVDLQPPSVSAACCLVSTLNALTPINLADTTFLREFVFRGLQGVVFIQAGEGVGAHGKLEACEDTYEVRRASLRFLARLAQMLSRSMLEYLDMIRNYTEQWWTERRLMWTERSMLYECMFMISNALSPQRQQELLQALLAPLEARWGSPEVTHVFSSPDAFIEFFNIDQTHTGKDTSDQSCAAREELLGIARTFHWAALRLKKSSNKTNGHSGNASTWAFASHLEPILPNTLAAVACLHGMWTAAVKQKIAPRYQQALQMGNVEASWRLNQQRQVKDLKEMRKAMETQDASLEHLRGFLEQFREVIYLMLRETMDLGPRLYGLPGLSSVLLRTVFTNLNDMDLRHLKILVRQVIKTLVVKCPPEYMEAVLPTILPGFFDYMRDYLSTHWQVVSERRQQTNGADENETGEVLEEGLVSDVTKDTMEVPWALLFPVGVKVLPPAAVSPSGMVKKPLSETEAFVLNNPGIRDSLANLAACSLLWPDSTAAQKGMSILLHITPSLLLAAQDPDMPAALLLSHSLRVLPVHGQHGELEGLVVRMVSYLLAVVPNRDPLFAVLRQLPSADPANIFAIQEFFQQEEGQRKLLHLEKLVRTALDGEIGRNVGQLFKKESTILDLPQASFMDRGDTKPKEEGELGPDLAGDIRALFET